jgi:hypothetical protein
MEACRRHKNAKNTKNISQVSNFESLAAEIVSYSFISLDFCATKK